MGFEKEKKQWEEEVLKPVTQRYPERKDGFRTSSGIELPHFGMPAERGLF